MIVKISDSDSARLAKLLDASEREAIAWHESNTPNLSADKIAAFRAGFQQGWRAAIGTVKLLGGNS